MKPSGSSGMDIAANYENNVRNKSSEKKLFRQVFLYLFQKNYEIQIRPRSGLGCKK